MAGWQWYYGFMLRHRSFTECTPEQTFLNRVKGFCRDNVEHFFRNLNAVRSAYPFEPSSIWNMDEIGFSTDPTNMGKIVSIKALKRVGQTKSSERGSMITLALAVSAAGNTLPPFYLFPQQQMSPMYVTHATQETVGYANGSGWMLDLDFVRFINHFTKCTRTSKTNPTLLLLDSHSSHLSVEAIDLAAENGITILTFPPHCSHRMQPLDVSVFGPVKRIYNAMHSAWVKENSGKTMNFIVIPKFVGQALKEGANAENIIAGFRATGIAPFDAAVYKNNVFVSLGLDEANAEASAIEKLYGLDEQRRIIIDPHAANANANNPDNRMATGTIAKPVENASNNLADANIETVELECIKIEPTAFYDPSEWQK